MHQEITLKRYTSIIVDDFQYFKLYLRSRIPRSLARSIITNPYKQYSHRYKCVFIHIPKTAGISISNALFDANPYHCFADKYQIFDPEKFNSYFKFSIVRNPWDRFLSAYKFLQKGGICSYDKKIFDTYCSKFNTFDDFVMSLSNKRLARKILRILHFIPQYKFICDNKSNIIMDYVGHFEHLNDDFEYIASKLGVDAKLMKLNQGDHKNYQSYYTKDSRDIVASLYKQDIELFDYKFEE